MAQINKIQFRRGSNLSNAGTPSAGEPIYDTTTKKLYIGDGTTAAAGATPSLVAISDDKLPLTGGTITGSLGVGASPSFKLDTQDNSTTWASRILNTNAGGQGLLVRTDATNGATAFGVYANNAYRLTITEALSTFSTNVTVGTKLKLIYGSTSEIKHDDASGSLTLLADQINLKNRAGNETGLTYNSGSGITFTNPSITGNLQLDQGYQLQWGGTNNAIFGHNGSNYVKIKTSGHDRFTIDSSGDASFTGTVRASGVFYANDNGASNPGFRFYNAASGMYHAGSDNLGFAVTGNNVATFTSSSATFAGGVAINGASIGSHKLVVDNGTTSLNRGNSSGDIIDIRGLNNSQLKVSTTGSQFRGNIGLNPGWVTTHIAFGSAISGFSATNTGARIEVPLHATSGQAHGSFKFYTNSGDTQNLALTLQEGGAAIFGNSVDVTNNVTIGTQQGNKELMTNRARMRHIDGVADANASFSHGDLYVNHISTGNIYMQRDTTFASQANFGTTASYIKQSNFGYSSSYKILQLGLATSTSAISLGADVTGNASGGFTGNEILIPNARGILAPNGANSAYLGVLGVTSNNTIEIGRGNHSIVTEGNGAISIATSNNATTFAGNITVNQLVNVNESGGSQAYLYSGGSFTALRTTSNHPLQFAANYSSGFDLQVNTDHSVSVAKKLYVTANINAGFGTELYNAHSTGHGLKVRGGSSGSQYALYVSNYNQTVGLFQIMGNGNTSIYGNLFINNPGSSSYIDIDGNTVSGEDGRIYIKGHTSSNSRAFIYFNNGQSSGGQNWYLGALRGSNAFVLSTIDDYNNNYNVIAVDGNRRIGINTDPTNSYRVKISGNIYSDTTSQFANTLIGEVNLNGTNYAMIGSNSSGRGIAFCRDGSASYANLVIKSNGNVSIGGDGGYQRLTVEGGNIYLTTGYQITWSNGNATISNSGYALSINTWDGSNVSECVKFNGSNVTEFRGRIQWDNGGQLDRGNSNYVKFNTWMQGGGTGGVYYPNSGDQNNPEMYPNGNRRTYGSFIFDGYNGTYGGIIFDDIHSNKPTWMFNTSANGGLYYQGGGGWAFFYNRGHSTFNVNGTSGSGYALYVHGSTYTTGSYSSSDRRLKENIKPLENSLDKVMQMQGVSFTRKEHGLKGEKVVEDNKLGVKEIGFIAQDLTEVLPEVVDQNEQTTQYSVNYGQVTALLVEAIKELKQEINDLKGN